MKSVKMTTATLILSSFVFVVPAAYLKNTQHTALTDPLIVVVLRPAPRQSPSNSKEGFAPPTIKEIEEFKTGGGKKSNSRSAI